MVVDLSEFSPCAFDIVERVLRMPVYPAHERLMLRYNSAELLEQARYFVQRTLNLFDCTRPVVVHRIHLHLIMMVRSNSTMMSVLIFHSKTVGRHIIGMYIFLRLYVDSSFDIDTLAQAGGLATAICLLFYPITVSR